MTDQPTDSTEQPKQPAIMVPDEWTGGQWLIFMAARNKYTESQTKADLTWDNLTADYYGGKALIDIGIAKVTNDKLKTALAGGDFNNLPAWAIATVRDLVSNSLTKAMITPL